MAKLESARDTVQVAAGATTLSLPVKGATTIFQGSIVALDESGFAVPGSKAENLKAVGRTATSVSTSPGASSSMKTPPRARSLTPTSWAPATSRTIRP